MAKKTSLPHLQYMLVRAAAVPLERQKLLVRHLGRIAIAVVEMSGGTTLTQQCRVALRDIVFILTQTVLSRELKKITVEDSTLIADGIWECVKHRLDEIEKGGARSEREDPQISKGIGNASEEISTTKAASILNVSRPYVVKLIEQGKLSCRMIGRYRRLQMAEVIEFQRRSLETALEKCDVMSRYMYDTYGADGSILTELVTTTRHSPR